MVVHSDKVVTMTWQANGMPRDLTSGRLVILHFVGIPQINKASRSHPIVKSGMVLYRTWPTGCLR